jgi:hypothetical protein
VRLPYVPPIPAVGIKSLHKAQDYKGIVRLIKRAMNIEDVTFQVVWVPHGAANKGEHKDSPAWVELPPDMPLYGTKTFKDMTIKMYFRKEFFERAYDEAAVSVAHEFSHIVLESMRHPLRKCEKVVDLTAMLLGFSRLYESACFKERRLENTIEIKTLGYLSREEVQLANQILAQRGVHGIKQPKEEYFRPEDYTEERGWKEYKPPPPGADMSRTLNPLRWKPEHRAALLVATVAGAALGVAFGYSRLRAGWFIAAWIDNRPEDVLIWALVGAIVVGAAVYCYRVFSRSSGN